MPGGYACSGEGGSCMPERQCVPRGACVPGGCACLGEHAYLGVCMPGGVCMPRGCVCPGGISHACPPRTEFLTHACENITFPVGGNK